MSEYRRGYEDAIDKVVQELMNIYAQTEDQSMMAVISHIKELKK